VVVACEAVDPAEGAAELAVETTGWAAELAVETAELAVEPADWVTDEAVLVTLDAETGGVGTETADGAETEGSPEAKLADAPVPTAAAIPTATKPTRISHFARLMGVVPMTQRPAQPELFAGPGFFAGPAHREA
jgi:hypothetical protein